MPTPPRRRASAAAHASMLLCLSACGATGHDQLAAAAPARVPVAAGATEETPSISLPPTKLGALVGPLYVPAGGQRDAGFYGTDLGVSFAQDGELRVLFGDTWQDPYGTVINDRTDDSQGSISLAAAPEGFPDGDAVDAYAASHVSGDGDVFWQHAAPPLRFELNANGTLAPIELYRGGDNGQPAIDMSSGKTIVTAFSNGRDGAFAIFRRDVAVACSGAPNPSCDDGYACDTGLGFCSNTDGEYATPCVLGSARCGAGGECAAIPAGGLCQDRTSSSYKEGDEDGRLDAVVIRHELGNADPVLKQRYYTRAFITNKFTNPIAKTVADFAPDRDPAQNDYHPADGSHPEREKVLLWGRPHTVGMKAAGRDARLYFAYVDMPEYSPSAEIAWQPHYLAAIERGRPRFSDDPAAAIALDLGGQPVAEAEPFDVVDKTAISYLAALHTWVMFYGGDFPPFILNLFSGPNYGLVQRDPLGSVHARFAEQPWGPWSTPVAVLAPGDASVSPPLADSEFAPGGMLRHPDCQGPRCIAGTPALLYLFTPEGFLYAPNIIDDWTETREDGAAVDVYWNVSTWNPYQVVLLKSRIRRGR